jgi:hypothetical protein
VINHIFNKDSNFYFYFFKINKKKKKNKNCFFCATSRESIYTFIVYTRELLQQNAKSIFTAYESDCQYNLFLSTF